MKPGRKLHLGMRKPPWGWPTGVFFKLKAAVQRSVFECFLAPPSGDIMAPFHMALTAVGLDEFVADVHRMHKITDHGARRDIFLLLIDHGVAEVTILGNDPAVPALMFSVVAAEAAREIEVADVIGICVP